MSLSEIFKEKPKGSIEREIVVELLNSDNNLDEKTELNKPLRWSVLASIENYLSEMKLKNSQAILEKFMSQAFKFLISKDRKGRQEYIEALNALQNQLDKNEEQDHKNLMME